MRMMKRVTFLCWVVLLAVAATARTAAGVQIAGGVAPAGASVGPLHAEDTNNQQQSYDMAFSARLSGAVEARDVATDSQGNVYITGGTGNREFPTTAGAFQRTLRTGGSSLGREGPYDVFVVKFRSDGKLLWSILLGGPNYDRAYAIEVDSQGNVYVAGRAGDGFPTTPGAVQPVFAGDVHYRSASASHYGKQDGFVAKLSSDGSRLIWASYFGTADQDIIRDMAIDAAGNVYLGVTTTSQPVRHITPDAYQTEPKGGGEAVTSLTRGGG